MPSERKQDEVDAKSKYKPLIKTLEFNWSTTCLPQAGYHGSPERTFRIKSNTNSYKRISGIRS